MIGLIAFQCTEMQSEEDDKYPKYVRKNHLDPGNYVWFYKHENGKWLVQFGMNRNTYIKNEYHTDIAPFLKMFPRAA
jgi:hypothetical protein